MLLRMIIAPSSMEPLKLAPQNAATLYISIVCPIPIKLWARKIPIKYEAPLKGEINKRFKVRCSRSATTVATLPPKQLKNNAAPTKVDGAAFSNAAASESFARSAMISPLIISTETGNIHQKIKLRFRRRSSVIIRCETAIVSCQYFIAAT